MTDTNPPVGATVVDTRGYAWRMAEDTLWHWIVGNGVQIAQGVRCGDHESALTLAWRLQQERDQLQAENAALRADKERLQGKIDGMKRALDEGAVAMCDPCMGVLTPLIAAIDAARGDA